jgi:hypothetical protein
MIGGPSFSELKEGWSKDHDAIFALRLERMG